jgi:hypothetical protein
VATNASIRRTLRQYAATRLGREPSDHDVDEIYEAMLSQIFKLGGRTHPGGYYLNVIILGFFEMNDAGEYVLDEEGQRIMVRDAQLKSPNDLMRLNLEREYRAYRNDWYRVLDQNITPAMRPRKPIKAARVMFQIFSNKSNRHQLDAEAKYSAVNPILAGLYNPAEKHSAVKPILDTLQANTVFSTTGKDTTRKGIGVLEDDTDGEHFKEGVIRQLEVLQRRSKVSKLQITIEEVPVRRN